MPVEIHGKQYVTVNERIQMFHDKYPNGAIHCHIVEDSPEGVIRISAMVCPDVDNSDRHFSGHAEEIVGSTQINRTSSLENAETSAIGRALGFLGLGVMESIATADEVANAVHQQSGYYPNEDEITLFSELVEHPVFDGTKRKAKQHWASCTTKEAVNGCLLYMQAQIEAYNEN
tara:strand:+ start:1312 stop:1833 length:522 start_codon:yes stop_codon:yes gene_type:complete